MLQAAVRAAIEARRGRGGALAHAVRDLDQAFERLSIYERWGACCLFMSHVAKALLLERGLKARTRLCTMRVGERGSKVFALGQVGFSQPGQVAAHSVCIVEDSLLLDYATGVARRALGGGFPRFFAAPLDGDGEPGLIAATRSGAGTLVRWLDYGYTTQGVAQELAGQRALADEVVTLVLSASRVGRELYDRLPRTEGAGVSRRPWGSEPPRRRAAA